MHKYGALFLETAHAADNPVLLGTGWENTEYRTYCFLNDNSDDTSMVETAGSKKSRRGSEKPLTKTERVELRETAKKNWEQHG